MNKFFAEYGRFLIAIVGSAFIFLTFSTMINSYKTYSEKFIETITGITNAQYIEQEGE